MRTLFALALAFSVSSAAAVAAPMVTSEGQPICEDADTLKAFIAAITKRDAEAAVSFKTCFLLKEGVRMTVIEGGLAHNIAKVHLFAHGNAFVVYTVLVPEQTEAGY